jgi:hypothetical protein
MKAETIPIRIGRKAWERVTIVSQRSGMNKQTIAERAIFAYCREAMKHRAIPFESEPVDNPVPEC